MKPSNYIFSALSGILICGLGACSSKPDNNKRSEAHSLYRESVAMIRLFSDSMRVASDSTRVKELSERFLHDLTALNFKYPGETDFEMTEGENDTLINLTQKYVALRDSMLYSFAHPIVASDSIPNDSITKY